MMMKSLSFCQYLLPRFYSIFFFVTFYYLNEIYIVFVSKEEFVNKFSQNPMCHVPVRTLLLNCRKWVSMSGKVMANSHHLPIFKKKAFKQTVCVRTKGIIKLLLWNGNSDLFAGLANR